MICCVSATSHLIYARERQWNNAVLSVGENMGNDCHEQNVCMW